MKKFMNFKVWFTATLFMLICAVGVSVFAYSSAFAGENSTSTDDDLSQKSSVIAVYEAFAVVEKNVYDGSINVTYLFDTEENVWINYRHKNVEIHPFENRYWRDDLLQKCKFARYTVDASFANWPYYPTDGYGLFYNASVINGLQYLNTENMQDMSYMFHSACIKELDLSKFDTRNVKTMHGMFYCCENLRWLNLDNFDTRNVTDMSVMFYNCRMLKQLCIANFDTSKVTDDGMHYILAMCYGMQELSLGHNFFNHFYLINKNNISENFSFTDESIDNYINELQEPYVFDELAYCSGASYKIIWTAEWFEINEDIRLNRTNDILSECIC